MQPDVSTVGAGQDLAQTVEELKRELDGKSRELTEALEYQTAVGEILRVISSSPNDAQPVFDTIAKSVARLFKAVVGQSLTYCHVFRFDGELVHLAAVHGLSSAGVETVQSNYPMAPGRGSAAARSIVSGTVEHIPDVHADPDYTHGPAAKIMDYRSIVAVPMLKDGRGIGAIAMARSQAGPFPDRQIALLRTFADQAVIAIENTRLFEAEQTRTRELSEALEYQTATSDVLNVISRSKFDLQPVLDVVAENAARVCGASNASLFRESGGVLRRVARYGDVISSETAIRDGVALTRGTVSGRAFLEKRTIHVADLAAELESEFPDARMHQQEIGHRTTLATPLLRDGDPLGVILIRRKVVQPFTRQEIQLLETFADQAVIAIENTRLFEEVEARTRELTESLEYQTATSDVLNVISRSPTNVQPVFDTIAQSATRLCDGRFAFVLRFEGELLHFAASHGLTPDGLAAFQNTLPRPAGDDTASGRAILQRAVVQIPDVLADPVYGVLGVAQTVTYRSLVATPLLRDGDPVGAIVVGRAHSGAFPEGHIRLLRTFADQAVIAIENTRLFEEVQARTRDLTDSLEQQTATSEVLSVISSSPGELEPVFQAMLENATRICEAGFGALFTYENGEIRPLALRGVSEALAKFLHERGTIKPRPGSALERLVRTKATIHIEDYAKEDDASNPAVTMGGARTYLAVPMLKDEVLIGLIVIYRQQVRPFSPKQIDLVTNFAAQAVIAIENVRLLKELRESLQQQTATADVLKVISRSPNELQPVLDTMLRTSARLCEADKARILRPTGKEGSYYSAASYGHTPAYNERFKTIALAPGRGSVVGRVLLGGGTVHIPDVLADPEYTFLQASRGEIRTILGVPLLRDGRPIGVFVLQRSTVRPFTDKHIELVETFADQAVIAIENTRLFEEVTALGEVGRAVSSTLDLKVVLKTIVDRAVELSDTDAGSIFYYRREAGRFELGETSGLEEAIIARFRGLDIAAGQTGLSEAIANRQPLQVSDVMLRPSNALRDAALEAGLRAALIVPLLSAEGPLGALVLQRFLPGEFPKAVVSLMQAFADQSVIALENARLFEEIALKSRELEIASQHKSQFVANMSHELRTPLAAILGYAELMQEGFYEPQGQKSLNALTRIRSNGKHLLGLINTVLDIAKIESGQFSLNLAEYSIDSMVETVRMATESLAETKKLSLTAEVTKKLPIGLGDEQRLTQVLLNLVGNAIKFTDSGEVRITATTANGHFTVAVTDTGPGIPPEEQKRVFEQFHQVDSSNTKAKGGTGLGLAIAKQIVEMHGGRIWVESTLGQGATFQMQLPIRAEFRKATS